MTIRKSAATHVDALAADLTSDSAVTRETAIARLTVIGPRAVDGLLAFLERPDTGAAARTGALRALEALGDARALDAALRATADDDPAVATAAVTLARLFLRGQRGAAVLDRLTALVLDRTRPEAVRLETVAALGDLNPSTLKPLWKALGDDPSPAMRARVSGSEPPPQPALSSVDALTTAAEDGLPDDPEALRRMLSGGGTAAPLSALHRLVERIREREAAEPPAKRGEWARARGMAHLALAKRSSRLGLYDLREALDSAATELPVEFLAALSIVGDASCLEAIASAYARAVDSWWRDHLGDTFQAIVVREGLTRRHAVIRKIEKRWGRFPVAKPA